MNQQEKDLVILEQKVIAMHTRLDKVEIEMAAKLAAIAADVKMLLENHHMSRGRASAFMLVGSLAGGLITAGVGYFLK
jgi:hypothetical protein